MIGSRAGTIGSFLHASDRPLFFQSARACGLAGPELIAGSEKQSRASQRIRAVPLVLGHDNRLSFQHASHYGLGFSRQQGHVEPEPFLFHRRDQVAEGHTRLDHGNPARPVNENDFSHAAQIHYHRAPCAGYRVAPKMGRP